jgi:hypothetical protein
MSSGTGEKQEMNGLEDYGARLFGKYQAQLDRIVAGSWLGAGAPDPGWSAPPALGWLQTWLGLEMAEKLSDLTPWAQQNLLGGQFNNTAAWPSPPHTLMA